MKKQTILISLVALPLLSAQAAITYVDAVEGSSGNTFETGSTPGDTAWLDPNGSFSPNETQWVNETMAATVAPFIKFTTRSSPATICLN